MASTITAPERPREPQSANSSASTPKKTSSSSYSLFPPIPAPLQRLFDLVPLVTYPANALPGEADETARDDAGDLDEALPTLFVFIDPADAVRGRASFNPTCLKWQTFLRFAGIPVRLAASTNHASPSGALPFLQPSRRQPSNRSASGTAPPPSPVPAHNIPAYAKTEGDRRRSRTKASGSGSGSAALPPVATTLSDHPRARAYQALLDTHVRRAWLHAVYLAEHPQPRKSGAGTKTKTKTESIAARLYARAASASPLVQAALAHQLRAAAAAEVWGSGGGSSGSRRHLHHHQHYHPTAAEVAQIYRDADAAFGALDTLLGENGGDEKSDAAAAYYFFGQKEPTLFDAAVFSYTHLLLEDDDGDDNADDNNDDNNDDDDNEEDEPTGRFRWCDRRLPDLLRAHPRLMQHRARIVARYWPDDAGRRSKGLATSGDGPDGKPEVVSSSVTDSVSWVKV